MIFLLGSLVYSLILKHIFVSFVTQVVVILSALSATGITSAAWGQAAVVTKYQSSVQYRVGSGQYRVDSVQHRVYRVSSTGYRVLELRCSGGGRLTSVGIFCWLHWARSLQRPVAGQRSTWSHLPNQ